MDENIETFAREMDKVYSLHKPKKGDSWKDCDIKYLQDKLIAEHREWIAAVSSEHIGTGDTEQTARELVDIANMCMMLFHRTRRR